jgi:threonine aldolase
MSSQPATEQDAAHTNIISALSKLAPPDRSFGSDNEGGAHSAVLSAIAEASLGHAVAYGNDRWTRDCLAAFAEQFGQGIETLLTWNGTGANVVALQALLPKYGAVICPSGAHINVDETGAPERILGAKLIDVPCVDGKLRPEQLTPLLHDIGVQHHVQPAVVSITQSTELGTVYSVDEIAAICDAAHRHGLLVHLDGARIANALVALGARPAEMTFGAGVDAVSFGGTKNGMLFGEAVLLAPQHAGKGAIYLRKQATQLISKMRFAAAQFLAMFDGDLWLESARHANHMAQRLESAVSGIDGVLLPRRVEVNSLFPVLPSGVLEPLQAWSPHYTWDAGASQARWVTTFDTTVEDVDRLAAGVAAACAAVRQP